LLGSNVFQSLNNSQTQLLSLLVTIDCNILDVSNQTVLVNKLSFNKNSTNSNYFVLAVIGDGDGVI
jgi:hypothetical protein